MVRLAQYMGIVHPGGTFEVSTTSIQVHIVHPYHKLSKADNQFKLSVWVAKPLQAN